MPTSYNYLQRTKLQRIICHAEKEEYVDYIKFEGFVDAFVSAPLEITVLQ